MPLFKDIFVRQGIVPISAVAGTTNGTAIDLQAFGASHPENVNLVVQVGAATGSPTALSVNAKLQQSSDNGSADAFSDVTDGAIKAITSDNGYAQVAIDARGLERYIRVVLVRAFTDGSTPAIPASAALVFTGCKNAPPAA